MLIVWVKLIGEGSSPYALSALARSQWVSALDHKVFNISVKLGSIVVPAVVFIQFRCDGARKSNSRHVVLP